MALISLTPNESIFCQALSMTTFIIMLDANDFLHSDYYKNLDLADNEKNVRNILEKSRLGNPATLQIFLYILLVMPKELLKNLDDAYLVQWETEINSLIKKHSCVVYTTYKNEDQNDLSTVDFYRHIRNAIAHSRCDYKEIQDRLFVTFKDIHYKDESQHCEITVETAKMGIVVTALQRQLMDYLNEQWAKRPKLSLS